LLDGALLSQLGQADLAGMTSVHRGTHSLSEILKKITIFVRLECHMMGLLAGSASTSSFF
jgi:hypothetical protein